jgi:hypothetical protein
VADNSLPYDCSTLVAGTSLCLGPSCALKTVQANQTCSDIINQAGGTFSVVQLVSWNPTIHANCDNLDGMVGRSICVSPPGTSSYSEGSMSIAPSPTMYVCEWELEQALVINQLQYTDVHRAFRDRFCK